MERKVETSMKGFWLLVVVAALGCGCSSTPPVVSSKTQALKLAEVDYRPRIKDGAVRLELPENSMGTGPHDVYHLFAQYHDGAPITYGLSIAMSARHGDEETAVLVNGLGELNPPGQVAAPLLLGKNRSYLEVSFNREFVEESAVAGRYFTLRSSRGTFEFPVPDWMFAALLEGLERRLPDLRKKSYNLPEVTTRDQIQERYVHSHPELAENIREAVLRGEVAMGMKRADVRASWGEAEMVMRGQDKAGGFEIWRFPHGRLMLEDGVVTVWRPD